MAWCDVVEPRTLRECRIALGQSQAAFAAMLGASPESYRTWDAGRRATPLKVLARARALATHRDDHELLPLPVIALLIGVHVKTLRAAARDGRLPVTYDTRTTFRHLRARATPAGARAFRRSYYGRSLLSRVSDRRAPFERGSQCLAQRLRRADSRATSRTRVESGTQLATLSGRGSGESRRLSMGRTAETYAVAPCSGNESPRSTSECGAGDQRRRSPVTSEAERMRVVSWNVNGIRACVRHGSRGLLWTGHRRRYRRRPGGPRAARGHPTVVARRPPGWHTAFTVAEQPGI